MPQRVNRLGLSLGDVMQESIQAAMTVAEAVQLRWALILISMRKQIYIFIAEGATPKDGPSAGIGMCTALVSVLANVR